MPRKLEYICLVGSIALIGADRIDLFAGHGSFKLTPFLIFAPLAILFHLLRTGPRELFRPSLTAAIGRQLFFIFALATFLLLSLLSTTLGLDPDRGLMAFADLVLISVLGFFISVRILMEPDQERLISTAIKYAALAYLFFCIGECIAWSNGLVQSDQTASSWLESTFAPMTFFWLPRFSGPIADSNRAGFVLVMYLALLDRFAAHSRSTRILRWSLNLFVLLTFSRSGILCWIAYYVFTASFWKRFTLRKVALGLAAVAVIASFVWVTYEREIDELIQVWQISDMVSDRVSGEQGTSGGDHIKLIERGIDTWSRSTHTVIAGIGLASAPRVLGDFFGDNKYGNFHCLYVTVLAELGLPAFLVLMAMILYPPIGRKGTIAAIAAIAVFNIPYQSHMEPVFWVVLALLWSYEPRCPMLLSIATTSN